MSTLTEIFREFCSENLKNQPLYLALGRGEPHWGENKTVIIKSDQPVLELDHPLDTIDLTTENGNAFTDFSWLADAHGIQIHDFHGADQLIATIRLKVPPAYPSQTTLVDPIAWIPARQVRYLTLTDDPEDTDVVFEDQGYRFVDHATPHLWTQFVIEPEAVSEESVREYGVVFGTKLQDEVAIAKDFYLEDDLSDPGKLALIQNLAPEINHGLQRTFHEQLITF